MKGAIFDMDGLLLDTERLYQESWVEMAKQFGQTPNPVFPSAVSGTNGEGMRQVIRQYYPEVNAFDFQAGCIARVEGILDEQGPPVKPGAQEILAFFRAQGVKTAVASSTNKERILRNLRQTGLRGLKSRPWGCPGVESSRDPWYMPARVLPDPPRTVPDPPGRVPQIRWN